MSEPYVLLQLSDPHLGADWEGADPDAALGAAVELARELRPAPGAVLISGDLTEHGDPAEYARVAELVGALGVPVIALPGNHDDRAALREAFGLPGAGAEPVNHTATAGPLRVIALDTTIPGEEAGALGPDQLDWLRAELADPSPTLLALHHPPIATAMAGFDSIGLPEVDRKALGRELEGRDHVLRVVCGHVHRPFAGEVGGRPVLAAPSTFMASRLDLLDEGITMVAEPAGFAVHAYSGGELVSHLRFRG